MPGTDVDYVPREVSQDVLDSLRGFFEAGNFRRSTIYVSGAVGSGKSRLGQRTALAYKEFAQGKALVGYIHLNMRDVHILDDDIDGKKMTFERKRADINTAQKFFARHIIRRNLGEDKAMAAVDADLAATLREWAAALRSRAPKPGLPVHIICHLDDVHRKQWASVCVVHAIHSMDMAGVRVIPVLTGLTTAWARPKIERISMTFSRSFHLTHLDPMQEQEQIRTLVVNAMNGVIKNRSGSSSSVLSLPFDTIDNLQHLADDCSGWMMSLVYLGGACAYERGPDRYDPARWDFQRVEEFTLTLVMDFYNSITGDVEAALGATPSAWQKLLLLAFSPFKVGRGVASLAWVVGGWRMVW